MSDKVNSSRYKKEIDAFLGVGKSARFISQWLADRGERISHVTISAYRGGDEFDPESSELPRTRSHYVESESDLARELLQKAIANLDSPSKTKNYIESFLKVSELAKLKELSRVVPMQDMREDVQSLKMGCPNKKIKGLVFGLFTLVHPYKQLPKDAITPEICNDFRRWQKILKSTLEPLFQGRNPLEEQDSVKC